MNRIALISPFTLPSYCGNSILAERLRQGLTGKGYTAAIFNSANEDTQQAFRFSPDIVHSFNAERTYQWMQRFRKECRALWIITLTGSDYNTWFNICDPPSHIKESLDAADAIVVFHNEVLKILSTALPEITYKIYVIPQGVTPSVSPSILSAASVRQKYCIKSEALVFLMAAGIRPVKNIGCAIKAFGKIDKHVRNAALILIGPILDREEADRILEMGKQLKCFQYPGELTPEEVRELMKAADVYLNTSLHEGMPGAVLEAMAEGLPVLASSVDGNRSLIKDGINGLLFPVDSQEDLVAAAIKLAHNQSLREKMGNAGRKIITKEHSPERELDDYEWIYNKLLDIRHSNKKRALIK